MMMTGGFFSGEKSIFFVFLKSKKKIKTSRIIIMLGYAKDKGRNIIIKQNK
jgi:hypothetical protein